MYDFRRWELELDEEPLKGEDALKWRVVACELAVMGVAEVQRFVVVEKGARGTTYLLRYLLVAH